MPKFNERLKQLRQEANLSQAEFAKQIGTSKSSINMYERGEREPGIETLEAFADYFNVDMDYLLGKSECSRKSTLSLEYDVSRYPVPTITDDVVTFPVIGDIAAGFDHVALEDYDSPDTVEIPASFLKGRPRSDFFVLRVTGNSMYPLYMNGDRVLIKKAPSLERSGEIGAVVYEDYATLKKIEYVMGEDWMKLIPINPEYQPKTITGADLEQCRVLGVPKLLIREIE